MKLIGCVLLAACLFCSCSKKKNNKDVEGTYVHEYSYTATVDDTGAEIGKRTVRDTVLIVDRGDQLEISNHKWVKNEYNSEEWKTMIDSDDRPFEAFFADFNGDALSIGPAGSATLFFNEDLSELYMDPDRTKVYSRK
jgi:hypothetical protein